MPEPSADERAEAQCQRAFFLLGEAEAVIDSLLKDPSDQVARVQAQLWLQELEVLVTERNES